MTWLSRTGTVASQVSPFFVIATPVVQPSLAKSPRSDTAVPAPLYWIVVEQLGTTGQVGPASPPPSPVPPSPFVRLGSCDDGQPARTNISAAAAIRIG